MLYNPKFDKPIEAPVKDEPWRQVLRDAADLLVERGWCQAVAQNGWGNICMGAAISRASGPDAPYGKVSRIVEEKLGRGLVEWNDVLGRTKEEVVVKLREIAES